MDDRKMEELVEGLIAKPKVVEVDGQKVENQSVGDLVTAAKFFASKEAVKGGKCPLRFTRMRAGGAIV